MWPWRTRVQIPPLTPIPLDYAHPGLQLTNECRLQQQESTELSQYQPVFHMLREGDSSGNLTVLKLTSQSGISIWALGVPQLSPSKVGPTWCYLVESDHVTLIDCGEAISSEVLISLLAETPFRLQDVDQLLVTHSHSDHDGNLQDVLRISNADLLGHPLYPYLRYRPASQPEPANTIQKWMAHYQQTVSARLTPHLDQTLPDQNYNPIINGHEIGKLKIIETPGHTPDSLCIVIDNFIITGDHILPYITSGASVRLVFPQSVPRLVAANHPTAEYYGLSTYLQSLKRIESLGQDYALLPGHLLMVRGRIRWQSPRRARQLLNAHLTRVENILEVVTDAPAKIEDIAKRYFHPRLIEERGIDRSVASIAPHIDFLIQHLYLTEVQDGRLFKQGSKQFNSQFDF